MCCGRKNNNFVRVSSTGTVARGTVQTAAVLKDFPALADAPPILVTDEVVFRWARNTRIARLLPITAEIKILEEKVRANSCKSCHKPIPIDRSAINRAKAALAECSDEIAKLVKQAANVLKYKVVYRHLSEETKEIIR
jgi:hypothetical protein